jgi:DNA-binding phage protein
MALTRDFKETIHARARRDPASGQALVQEAVATMLEGDLKTGKAVLRDYINATIGFEALARATGTAPKSLMRMFSPRGNPQASNLFAVLRHLQEQGGFHLEVRTKDRAVAEGARYAASGLPRAFRQPPTTCSPIARGRSLAGRTSG